ncbi:MAG TPA: DUF6675 family protein [Bryobacteraceae bacterium]|nr:DUF6675 family protein [Bryobacteraceae bacterium]
MSILVHNSIIALAALCAAFTAQAQPQPPCGASPVPPYPAADAAPSVRVWEHSDWTPPACTGWARVESATLVATTARFHNPGGSEALRRRLAAVSALAGLLYWSTTHQKWQPLIVDAYALTAADGPRRADFVPGDVAAGRSLYALQEDTLLGKVVYETRIATAESGRLVFVTRNAGPIQYFGLTLFRPGDIQSVCFLDRDSTDVWRYYAIARIPKGASLLIQSASLINRATALYRYLAGIPADREPPAAR